MPATLNDVAHAAGVSNVTASRVLTSKQSAVPISEATCRHVLDAAAHLSYRPNLLARGSRTQRSGAVAVMVKDIGETRRTVPVRCSCPSWLSGAPWGRCAPL
jgi:DNA-binding LacI/PurR family transcriptional regulator